ncbi:secondary thiamine-phosphate synthase enzyme YjbQ [Legionella gresilensis]|uniref:secondary thiamine-phosphate synthase enzyme YjbQ n=1 Tax=Legionella gresilensis TaxID=91823 RepID=UPI00104150EB|nr:secondary thiamine-phosphate synthase enzyme YjbQ [Legionella gresilensis]
MAEQHLPFYSQIKCTLDPQTRGVHLITDKIQEAINKLPEVNVGLVHLFLQHTSASLLISENASEDVWHDLETHLNHLAPDNEQLYTHTIEGPDDMPAHIKNAHLGSSLSIPITNGKMALGRWQGIFLCEHRNHASARHIVITLQGMK